jgi:hypothetical protein
MGSFPEHVTEAVKNKADHLNIEIILVPEGWTGDCQPLDRSRFGVG